MRARLMAFGVAAMLTAFAAAAQALPGTRVSVRGTIERFDGHMLTVKSRAGGDVAVALTPHFAVQGLEKKRLSDIHQGDFVASTGHKGSDGKLHAIEVRIFPKAPHGGGGGQFPWDLSPGSVMTNATVTGISGAPQGETLTVTYKGHHSTYIVDPDTPILSYTKGDASQLKPGIAVFVYARKEADGRIVASGVTAETNGIKPPM